MVDWAVSSRARVTKEQVANAFLSSLTSRRLDWRSVLGSFSVSLNFPVHHWSTRSSSQFQCPVCGTYERSEKEDLSILNFERFKWGGVRHTDPLYIGFDLDQSSREEPPEPTSADRSTMRAILGTAGSMPPSAKLSDLTSALSKVLLSNASERRTLIGILGYAGILRDPSKPGFMNEFPSISQRPIVPWTKNDWPYPVQWWNGSCGVSNEATDFWFPNL